MLSSLRDLISRVVRRDVGQTIAEYAVMLALITLAVVGALTFLAGAINGRLEGIGTTLGGVLP